MSVSKWGYDPKKCDGDICMGDCDYCTKAMRDNPLATDGVGWSINQDDAGMVTIKDYQGSVHAQFMHEPLRNELEKQSLLELWLYLMKDIGDRLDDAIMKGWSK